MVHLPIHPTRSTMLERIAMRLGMRLLIWSTRPLPDPADQRHANQQYRERQARELSYVLMLHDRSR